VRDIAHPIKSAPIASVKSYPALKDGYSVKGEVFIYLRSLFIVKLIIITHWYLAM
jgi:hypothetical protein